jgi:hypothetical protein
MRKAVVKIFEIYEQEVVVTIEGKNETLPIEEAAGLALENGDYVYNNDPQCIGRLPLATAQFVQEVVVEEREG